MKTNEPKRKTFTAVDAGGARYLWKYWRDARVKGGGLWFLEDPERCVRSLEATWTDSAPRIRTVLANYSQATPVALENLR